MSEFQVDGSQMLSSLKDSMSCLSDSVQLSVEHRSPRHRSGYFFIENVFYNDLRDPECIDYSEFVFFILQMLVKVKLTRPCRPIIQWIQTKERASQPGLGMYETARIDQVRFIDLTLRLNYPYLYCHQGNCEHLLIFKEIRLVHPTDPPHQVSYPLQTYLTKTMPPVCQICQLFPGERVTWNDLGAPDQPYVWCHQCFQEFHFDAEGRVLLPHESLEVRLLEDEPPFGNPPEIPENL